MEPVADAVRRRIWATPVLLAAIVIVTGWEFATVGLSPTVSELARSGGMSIGAILRDEWWSITAANFLHGGVVHLIMNSFVIMLLGSVLERAYGGLIVVTTSMLGCLGASAGALFIDNGAVTIGASGIGFALMGCAFAADVRARTQVGRIARQLLPINLLITFAGAGVISVGGHLGGLVAGIIVGLLLVGDQQSRPMPIVVSCALDATLLLVAASFLPQISLDVTRSVQARIGPGLVERQVAFRVESNDGTVDRGPSCTMQERSIRRWVCTATIDGDASRFELAFEDTSDQFLVTNEA